MGLLFTCSGCGSNVFVRFASYGGTTRCVRCGEEVRVPEDAVEMDDTQGMQAVVKTLLQPEVAAQVNCSPEIQSAANTSVQPPVERLNLVNRFGESPAIKGWLVLPAISIVIAGLMLVYEIGTIIQETISVYNETDSLVAVLVMMLFVVVLLGMLAFLALVAIEFYGKRKGAPKRMIQFIVAGLVVNGVWVLLAYSFEDQTVVAETTRGLVQSGISAAIWIPYFMFSERVKATFIR